MSLTELLEEAEEEEEQGIRWKKENLKEGCLNTDNTCLKDIL